jgi:transcriptional regulator with XRE-family HTH domain
MKERRIEALKAITEKRKSLGLTQEQVSCAIGYKARQNYNNFESGRRLLPLEPLKRLQGVLEMKDEEMWQIIKNWN